MSETDLRARILADVARTPSLTRAQYTQRLVVIGGAGALASAALFFAMGGVHVGARPLEMLTFTAGVAFAAALVLTRLSTRSSGSMLGRPRVVLLAGVLAGAAVLALAVLASALWWPAPARLEAPFGSTLACGAITLVQGALPLLVLVAPRRGSDPVHPAVTGAALGMAAGAWSATMAYLRCAHAGSAHCLLAHVLPTLGLVLMGALLGGVVLRMRAR